MEVDGNNLWCYVIFVSITYFEKARISLFFYFVADINLQKFNVEGGWHNSHAQVV